MQINRPVIVALIVLSIAQLASAADDLSMSHLRLSIWPAFDDPRVLVILRGEMTPAQAFPTHIALPLPKGADIVGAGMVTEQNELLNHPHRVIPGDQQDTLDLNLPSPRFFLEFYYNPLTPGADQQFTYDLSPAYAIERLEVDIQQPRHATNFTLQPPPMRQSTDEQGLRYNWFMYRDVKPQDKLAFHISYTRTADGPSVARQPTPAAPDAVSSPLSSINPTLLAFAILVGVAIVGSAVVWLFKVYQQRHPTSPASPSPTPPANFCSNCGAKLKPEHRFCPTCGHQL